MNETCARPELVKSSIKQKLLCFPKFTVNEVKLYNLVDNVVEINSLKKDEQYYSLLASMTLQVE